MIKKKINSLSLELEDLVEKAIANDFLRAYKYIILNEFVTYMRTHFDLSYTNEKAIKVLLSLGLKRKRISFETSSGVKHSRNEFINEKGLNKNKHILEDIVTHDETVERVAKQVLDYIKNNFDQLELATGIINFNLYNSEDGIVLIFDNNNLKKVLSSIKTKFFYRENMVPTLASKIRSLSESSFIRENDYRENSIRVNDKKFYVYTFKGEK